MKTANESSSTPSDRSAPYVELPWLGDAGTTLHLLTSLIRQAEQALPAAVAEARDQEYSWAQIARMLGTTPTAARQRYFTGPA